MEDHNEKMRRFRFTAEARRSRRKVYYKFFDLHASMVSFSWCLGGSNFLLFLLLRRDLEQPLVQDSVRVAHRLIRCSRDPRDFLSGSRPPAPIRDIGDIGEGDRGQLVLHAAGGDGEPRCSGARSRWKARATARCFSMRMPARMGLPLSPARIAACVPLPSIRYGDTSCSRVVPCAGWFLHSSGSANSFSASARSRCRARCYAR